MKTKLIEVQVHGFTGDGKTNVCKVIRDALIQAYGPHTQVASRDLALEYGHEDDNKPTKAVVFSICEVNHGSVGTHTPA